MGTTLAATLAVAVMATAARAGILSSSYTPITASNSGTSAFVNFADEGTADWAIWDSNNFSGGAPSAAKTGADLIGDAYTVGTATGLGDVGGTDLAYSTTPGATSGSQFDRAIYGGPVQTSGAGVGIDITLPTLDLYTVRVYVGGFKAHDNPLTATLGTGTPVIFSEDFGAGNGGKDAGILALQLQADSLSGDNNVLHVTIALGTPDEFSANTHVLLQGATVAVPEPASGALALLGLGGLMLGVRRRRYA